VFEYSQSGERIRSRRNIQLSRNAQPNRKRFAVRRIIGTGDLWVTEYVLSYDGRPSYTVLGMKRNRSDSAERGMAAIGRDNVVSHILRDVYSSCSIPVLVAVGPVCTENYVWTAPAVQERN
jgi:hypothetical protein